MDLFDQDHGEEGLKTAPLARRMRPASLDEFVGQEHILSEGMLFRRMIEADRLTSVILYGPPGSGKTTLAHIIATTTKAHFERINAVTAGVAYIRAVVSQAKNLLRTASRRTILFIDEIYRFNKVQQDVLLPDVEDGNVILIGATVENPFFYIVSTLISRSQVFELKPLSDEAMRKVIWRALGDGERGLGGLDVNIDEAAIDFLVAQAGGDARRALNGLEIAVLSTLPDEAGKIHVTLGVMEESVQRKAVRYDRAGDDHYDTISAFIKSMRGSDPDATLYWLAKMIYAGEDPRFIARRIAICAAEDVGNADPQALILANAALSISEFVGMPEAEIPLAQAAAYVATAPKSNASYSGLSQAKEDIREGKVFEVPTHLREAGYPGARKLGRGKGYKYAHSYPGGYVDQPYLPEERTYYRPTDRGYEAIIKRRLDEWRRGRQPS